MTDTERLDFLVRQLEHGHVSFAADGAGFCQMRDYVQVFTVGSQHVYGRTLREALDAAIARELAATMQQMGPTC